MVKHKEAIIIIIICAIFITGCQSISALWKGAEPTPTARPLRELNICVRYEPATLYLYSASSQIAGYILQALYDGPFDRMRNGEIRAVILEEIPSMSNGGARFTPVSVHAGDLIVDMYGYPTSLEAGTNIFPSGCTNAACAITWDGTSELQMDELSAEYKLLPGLKWSDGEALTAFDSVFSFKIAEDSATPGSKIKADQTAAYSAKDERTISWRAKPGLVTNELANYFWSPLPEHSLGSYSASDLLTLEAANRAPIGWGAYALSQWASGAYIRLDRNMHYFRTEEGIPFFDTVFFRFMDAGQAGNFDQAQCDIQAGSMLDMQNIDDFLSSQAASSMNLFTNISRDVETLAIGIKPASYDDSYYPFGADRPDIFGDVRTRQAIAHCIDRATLTEKLLKGYAEAAISILPANDPIVSGMAPADFSYNPTQAKAMLDAVGWKDLDQNPQTPLTASYVFNVPSGTPFQITLHISDAGLQGEIAREIAANLANCGIQADIVQMPAEEIYQPAPEGIVFGRQFDLALVPWRLEREFRCNYYTTNEIPSDDNYWLGETFGGTNFYGYSSAAYDQACQMMMAAGMDDEALDSSQRQVLEILSTELPLIPLFHYPEFTAVDRMICGMEGVTDFEQHFVHIETYRDDGACP